MERYYIEQHHQYDNGKRKPILQKLHIIDRTNNKIILEVNMGNGKIPNTNLTPTIKQDMDIIDMVVICEKLNNEDQAYRETVSDFLTL